MLTKYRYAPGDAPPDAVELRAGYVGRGCIYWRTREGWRMFTGGVVWDLPRWWGRLEVKMFAEAAAK